MKMNGLLLITSGFPRDENEPFLLPEFKEFSEVFDQILIVPIDEIVSENVFQLPSNTEVFKLKLKRFYWRSLFLKTFWNECKTIVNSKQKINRFLALKTATKSWMRIVQIEKQISKELSDDLNWFAYSFWSDDAAIVLSRLQNNKIISRSVSRAHGFDLYEHVHLNPYLPFREFVFSSIHQIITDSNHGSRYLNDKWNNCLKSSVITKYLGAKNQEYIQRKINSNCLTILSCATVVPIKRLHLIADALKKMYTDPIHWIHIGGGKGLEDLKKHCVDLPNNIRVTFKGHLANNEILYYYKELDELPLFVNVSASEGVPVALMEAFSFGFPALVTDVGGNTEIVDDHVNGMVIHKDFSHQELIEKVTFFIRINPEEKLLMSQNAIRKQTQFFESSTNASDVCKVLIRPV